MRKLDLWLPNGTKITLKGKTYDDLLCEIDNFFDIFKENVDYYRGYDDETVIEQAKEEEIYLEMGDE